MNRILLALLVASSGLVSCGGVADPGVFGSADGSSAPADQTGIGATGDATVIGTGSTAPPDSGVVAESGAADDATTPEDATVDASSDQHAPTDGGGGVADAGRRDAGAVDSGSPDATFPCGTTLCDITAQTCCVRPTEAPGPAATTASCVSGTACPATATVALRCLETTDCPTGDLCCLAPNAAPVTTDCRADCTAGRQQVCDPTLADAGCPRGERCTTPAAATPGLPDTIGVCQ